MQFLLIVNDPPYGSERAYNAFRLALSLANLDGARVLLFLIGDAVGAAVAGQATPQGYYNLERMLRSAARRGCVIGVCGSCMDARGIKPEGLVDGARRSSMEELAAWTREADRVLVF
jgi:uncharacterized protein involved in oxidation of intracellular sulfur